jgi:hypothetical protein
MTSNPNCGCCKARFIKFILCDEITAHDSRQRALVLEYWDGENPALGAACPPDDENAFYVYNMCRQEDDYEGCLEYSFSAPKDAVGYAVLDEQTGLEGESCNYRIVTLTSVGAPIIMFVITEANFCGECTARARVLAQPVGGGSLPDVEYDLGRIFVTVYDKTYPSSCFLNEPPEDLLNRIGFAVYLDALTDGPCPDTYGPRWHIFSLCCADAPCEAI